MKNKNLVKDYILRAENRLVALNVLYERGSWADVVREAQEIVELALKALLRHANIEVPRIHDVGDVLVENKDRFSKKIRAKVQLLAKISHSLRRDRELAFYGSEDLTPSEFYKENDAKSALQAAVRVVKLVKSSVK